MAKLFSFASWNVEPLNNAKSSSGRITDFLVESGPPDVFGIFEVRGSQVFSDFVEQMPSHQFFITEDLGPIEILIGVTRDLQACLTQRAEFKSQIPTLRPGAGAHAEGQRGVLQPAVPAPEELRRGTILRSERRHDHARAELEGALDKATDQDAKFLALGALNTMGMNLPHSDRDEPAEDEVARYGTKLKYRDMRPLPETHDVTSLPGHESPRYEPPSLDDSVITCHGDGSSLKASSRRHGDTA